jgi:hypothetical protein
MKKIKFEFLRKEKESSYIKSEKNSISLFLTGKNLYDYRFSDPLMLIDINSWFFVSAFFFSEKCTEKILKDKEKLKKFLIKEKNDENALLSLLLLSLVLCKDIDFDLLLLFKQPKNNIIALEKDIKKFQPKLYNDIEFKLWFSLL